MSLLGSLAPIVGTVGGFAVGGPVGAAIGGGLGGAWAGNEKYQNQLDRQHKTAALAAETARYSPWTHMTPNQIQWAGSGTDEIGGGALGGAASGYMLGSALKGVPADPLKGATQVGANNALSPMGQQLYGTAGNGMMAGGFEAAPAANSGFSPWPNMYSNNNQYGFIKS